ncbi:MAG: ABC transporter permease subunit [Bacteroidales bacterium]|nr:ABC transporter permease subunit [Bacteroidales bacterium]
MKSIIKIEFRKLFKSPAFWLIIGLYTVSLITILAGTEAFINKVVSNAQKNSPIPIPTFSLYAFPYVWHNLTYVAGLYKFLPAFTVILFITNEYSYRTIRHHIITGMSRESFFASKLLSTAGLSILSGVTVFLTGIVMGLIYTDDIHFEIFSQKLSFLPIYMLEIFAYLSFAFMIGVIAQKAGLAIIIFVIYVFIAEPILSFRLHEDIAWFLPLKTFGRMIDVPNTALMKLFGVNFRETIQWIDVAMTLLYTLLFNYLSLLRIKKTDI